MAEPRHYYYDATVTFHGDYFTLVSHPEISVDADEDLTMGEIKERAIEQANEFFGEHYGWHDVESLSIGIEVEVSEGR